MSGTRGRRSLSRLLGATSMITLSGCKGDHALPAIRRPTVMKTSTRVAASSRITWSRKAGPAHLRNGRDIVADDRRCEAARQTLVKQDAHQLAARALRLRARR